MDINQAKEVSKLKMIFQGSRLSSEKEKQIIPHLASFRLNL